MQDFEFSKTFGWTPEQIDKINSSTRIKYIAIIKGKMNASED